MYKNKLIVFVFLMISLYLFHTEVLSKEIPAGKNITEVLDEMEKANSAFKTLKADIVYTRAIVLLESTETSQGKMSYKKPKKLYLKFYPPRNEVNIVDGRHIWVYHPSEKQVEKYEIGSKQSSQGMGFFEFGYGESVEAAKKNYKITLSDTKEEGKKRIYILDLLPKDPKSQYTTIRLWVEEGFWLPGKIELRESEGEVVNTIEFKNIRLNKNLSDKLFTFNVPRGVEVIEPFK
ncbi:MAG: outer membrane lipoprotein carrier protein LolA [Candidatus Jettenia sp.]|uniref:Outer membrane lipoprotein carrier protein LolA n=1 Tax=Candidatus Jettenia caeni TaxID=247490 RepID=I3IQS0_9BACT|nr:outer membrane lipoprotein carrier protein LolA [Candidatus Jettenia sp. AMX1]MBC6928217.1 outer membrane lipoprotein carrier protein LolA [Candidatus Jettenia sp.]WKZ15375.1 MAG: outer membrane lipoprotein carrier protein LolA [Candidatus Jettenia caeni]KAA0248977.1 MAG: outer membrane lipoprotein carrier protein LolA [Candidatus Jettenia sp. AMX1]MCE7879606.1 outer membrane lipoprotein carrier protein LolA [Candidatus Jettenia sp. AMX1]MCQ3926965.1 outer membrane lipoprotein carrier prote